MATHEVNPAILQRLDEFLATKGLRRTKQREVIIRAAFGTTEHFTADELWALARDLDPATSQSERRKLELAIEKLDDERAAVTAEVTAAETQKKFIEALVALPNRPPPAASSQGEKREEWGDIFALIGARLAEAEKACGARLVEIDGSWARAYARVLRGEPAFPTADADQGGPKVRKPKAERSIWEVLDLAPDATVAEVKRAYRKKALETHPDRGGDDATFREVQRAYELALERRTKAAGRPTRAKKTPV